MFKEIGIKETIALLCYAGVFASDDTMMVPLGLYPKYYRLQRAWQYAFSGDYHVLVGQLKGCMPPPIPADCKVTIVFEMTVGCSITQMNEFQDWIRATVGEEKLERFEPVFIYGDEPPFTVRITVIYHDANRRRAFYSHIFQQHRYQEIMDERIFKMVNSELRRNDEIAASIALEADDISALLTGKHYLWAGIANSHSSTDEVFRKLRREMEHERRDFCIDGLLLFVETDKSFSTEEEIEGLVHRFACYVGKGVELALNVRSKDSFIKYITCRAVLIGGQKYEDGDICEDCGQLEVLLCESGDNECGFLTVACHDEGELTLSRYDWGVPCYEDRIGRKECHHSFDKENTMKLFASLHVKRPEALLRTIRRRFALQAPAEADTAFLDFCQAEGIDFAKDGFSMY